MYIICLKYSTNVFVLSVILLPIYTFRRNFYFVFLFVYWFELRLSPLHIMCTHTNGSIICKFSFYKVIFVINSMICVAHTYPSINNLQNV